MYYQFQVNNTIDGYVVEVFIPNDNSLRGYWFPLRNFGDRQGDAIAFRDWGVIDNSVLIAAGQFLTLCATGLGVKEYVSGQIRRVEMERGNPNE